MDIIFILNIVGIIAFAISGAMKGIKYSLDLLGIIVLGVITAIGGGIIRDVLLNTTPLILKNELDIILAINASIFPYFFVKKIEKISFLVQLFDALGLAVFAVIGATRGIEANLGIVGVIIMGTLTGVAGGMLRDILVGEIPFVLKEDVYASFAIAGSLIYYLLIKFTFLNKVIIIYLVIFFIFIGRLFAIKFKWNLPKAKVD